MNSLEDFFQLRTSELQFETMHAKQDEFPFHFGYQTDIVFMLSVDQRLFFQPSSICTVKAFKGRFRTTQASHQQST